MDFNLVEGKLAFARRGGYFYSPNMHYLVSFNGKSLEEALDNPGDGRNSLGEMIRGYQEILIEGEKEGILKRGDWKFICESIGTGIVEIDGMDKEHLAEYLDGKFKEDLKRDNVLLRPFEMGLKLEATDLENGEVFKIKRNYKATNVKLGHWFRGGFGIRYDLVPND